MTLKQELKKKEYWFHIALMSFIVLAILQFWKGGNMLSIMNWLISIPLLVVGDIFAGAVLSIKIR